MQEYKRKCDIFISEPHLCTKYYFPNPSSDVKCQTHLTFFIRCGSEEFSALSKFRSSLVKETSPLVQIFKRVCHRAQITEKLLRGAEPGSIVGISSGALIVSLWKVAKCIWVWQCEVGENSGIQTFKPEDLPSLQPSTLIAHLLAWTLLQGWHWGTSRHGANEYCHFKLRWAGSSYAKPRAGF